MRLLLDTHALLWWHADGPLRASAHAAIAEPSNVVLVSAVSIWEIAIKIRAGRLRATVSEIVQATRGCMLGELAIRFAHGERAGLLPLHHRDPFDRMLVAQAQLESLTIVTRDTAIARYDVAVMAA